MRLANQHSFLTVELPDDSKRFLVQILPSLKTVLRSWKSSSRVSPIIAVEDLGPTGNHVDLQGKLYLIFLGPVSPEDILKCDLSSSQVWLTLGLFNVFLVTDDVKSKNAIARWAKKQSVPRETWTILDGIVLSTEGLTKNENQSNLWGAELAKLFALESSAELSQTIKDYCPLMATTLARSHVLPVRIASDLLSTHQYIIDTLDDYANEKATASPYPTLGEVLTVQAALTRFNSQTLSGTERILDRECHLRSHSLLGIGIPNIALAHLRQFLESTLGGSRLPERLTALKTVIHDVPNLVSIPDDHAIWFKDHLASVDLPKETSMPEIPLLSHFSVRDGFKSTLTTLSAPLNAISACNSVEWSLLTVTHEYSHVLIKTILAEIYPNFESDQDVKDALALLKPGHISTNLFDEIRRLLLFTLVYIDRDVLPEKEEVDITSELLVSLLDRHYREIQEILVHVFDFLYFYGSDIDKYIAGIWNSWGTIPNINNRIKEYVIRTICAALVNNLRRPNAEEMARDQVLRSLTDLNKGRSGGSYITRAIDYINNHWDDEIFKRVFLRRDLVRITRAFLFSETIASEVRRETELKGGEPSHREGYDLRVGYLESKEIRNPIHFLELYTKSRTPSVSDSAWMYFILAFYLRRDAA